MKLLSVSGYQLTIYGEAAGQPCPVLWLHSFPGEAEQIWAKTRRNYILIAVTGMDWNAELSPWPAAKAFASGEDFAGQAADYLTVLTKQLIPEAEGLLPFAVADRGLVGYSMAGLFAVYAMYHWANFSRIGSISGSLWYDGWLEYALTQPMASHPKIYLSLGSKEHVVRNERMSVVKQSTDRLAVCWRQSCTVRYDTEPGSHFTDPLGRISRGIDRLLDM